MVLKGIDVSKHKLNIDWEKVKGAGVDFAIIRAGYGKRTIDAYFERNVKGCIENGIKIGFYWFLYCLNEEEAVKNAEMFHTVIKEYKNEIEMGVWCDFEYDTDKYAGKNGVVFDKKTRTACVNAFCDKMKSYGYNIGNYANPDYLKNKFNKIYYPLWLAKYSTGFSGYKPIIWQFSNNGNIPGINGRVDLNIYYGDKNPYAEPTYTLFKGRLFQKKEYVMWLQFELNEMGYELEVDGSFGKKTDEAFRDFQIKHPETYRTKEPDGRCGPASRKVLKSL